MIQLASIDTIPLATLNDWQNTPSLTNKTMGFRFPVQNTTTENWRTGLAQDNGKSSVYFSILSEDQPVGLCCLRDIDWISRTAALGIFIGLEQNRGQGIGRIACQTLLEYAFFSLNLERIYLHVAQSNTHASKLYRDIGFVKEGCLRQHYFAAGTYDNVDIYGILLEEFKKSG